MPLDRNWIGIDISFHAIRIIEDRLAKQNRQISYDVGGVPRDFESAQRLALKDKFQFQWWANYLVGVQALKEVKRGPDRGIDGEMYFMNGPKGWGRILTSVKGGQHVGAKDVREFKAAIERERAEMGLFICLNAGTREMKAEAASFGFHRDGAPIRTHPSSPSRSQAERPGMQLSTSILPPFELGKFLQFVRSPDHSVMHQNRSCPCGA